MKACLTGSTGFVGGHVARVLAEAGHDVRVTYRDGRRLARLGDLELEAVKADVLDGAAMRRAARGADVLFHCAGVVGARPVARVWEVNAVAPRVAVEAAAAAGVPRVVVTSSVAGIGPAAPGEVGDERDVYTRGHLGLTYVDAKHEGETGALAAGARLGVDVVIVNPSYVLGVPVDRTQPGETSTRTVGNYLRGRLPAVVDGFTNIVDVEDVARGHLLAAEKGRPGERYVLGGHNRSWVEVIDRIAELSGVSHPLLVIPPELASAARTAESLGLPGLVSAEGVVLMAQNWRYSSRKARRELGFRARTLDRTLRATIDWYLDLIERGAFAGSSSSALSLASAGMRVAERLRLVDALRGAEERLGRRLVAGAR
ncbi:MAG: NAD-dependent epimerase/dehydratase family protein [Thermoleophilaceae bacterium]